MKYGLSEKQLQEIKDVLASYEEVEEAVLFGSRAIDTYKEASDIDIVIKGEQADFMLAAKIKGHFEDETYLPFFFDIISYNSIDNDELKKHIKTKGKILYRKGWRTCTLGDVAEVKYGKEHKNLKNGQYPCFGSGGFMRFVDSFLYDDESILIPRKGSLNNVMYQDKPFWTVDTMFWTTINKEKANPKFLFYQLVPINYTTLNVGSAVPSLTVPIINEIEISLPPLPEQKAIGEVLSSLDDKIDLLHRQNKTLESLAETLFRHHFIENAQDDWEEKQLDDIKELQSQANSGVQVNLTTQSIKDSEFLIPPIEKQKEVLHMFEEIFCKLDANTKQIQTLEKLRDTLLPKLISGDVRVEYKEVA